MKGNNNKYWFKRRRYGFGWFPVSWEAWCLIVIYLLLVIIGSLFVGGESGSSLSSEVVIYLGLVLAGAVGLIFVSYLKGPKPKWRWGSKPTDNPTEDF
ncbi:hypothetical protein KC946_03195 [Candidatus Saccharibacteria bacterium]|nr:hypothetical protein [Candidatus Saccharibacteria bacterium]